MRFLSFLCFCVAVFTGEVMASTHQKLIVIVDSEYEQVLETPEFLSWKSALSAENYDVSIKVFEELKNPDAVKNEIKKNRADYSLIIGNFVFPTKNVFYNLSIDPKTNEYVHSKNKRQIPSLLSWMNSFKTRIGFIKNASSAINDDSLNRLRNYFRRNVEYRNCETSPRELLVGTFIDESWQSNAAIKSGSKTLSSNSLSLPDWESLIKLGNGSSVIDFLELIVHSSAVDHSPVRSSRKEITIEDIRYWNPKFRFINLVACFSGDPSWNTNLADTYLLWNQTVLGVFAPSNSGGILDTSFFYGLLKSGASIGEALLQYMKFTLPTKWFEIGPELESIVSGLILYGDPTLKLRTCRSDET